MDVDQRAFNGKLLGILKHIADADYVTFDLEMSGISSGRDRTRDAGKPSLQKHYEEMKSAAETFQVVQIGICCVQAVKDKGYYLARPYNIYLSPLELDYTKLRLERTFSFSSSACKFLKENRFDFGKIFTSGITYLSRKEENDMIEKYNKNLVDDRPDILCKPGSPELTFYRWARDVIAPWAHEWTHNRKKSTPDYVNLSHKNGKDLSALERRLIYQLIRSEFPGFQAEPRDRGTFMAIKELDPEREGKFQARQLEQLRANIAKQTGVRWIIEALTGGNLDGIDVTWFSKYEADSAEREATAVQFDKIKKKLHGKKHVIVGHNLFMDLGFIWTTFFGPLPDRVTVFQNVIHRIFPRIFDTKFLHTEKNLEDGSSRETLKEILHPFKKIHAPLVLLAEDHGSYNATSSKDHEAGYDSWMTAELFVKLSMQLYEKTGKASNNLIGHSEVDESSDKSNRPADYHERALQNITNSLAQASVGKKQFNKKVNGTSSNKANFETSNPFDALSADDEGDRYSSPDPLNSSSEDEGVSLFPDSTKAKSGWLPDIDDPFWETYLNKLRVTASEGGVCDLNPVFMGM